MQLTQIRSQREAFANDWKTIETASATTWDSTKTRLDKEWSELKAMVDPRRVSRTSRSKTPRPGKKKPSHALPRRGLFLRFG